ncbi:MAG: nitrilase-related carbon-nitrogen hydrolase [Kineosporiaceae bacterium]
MAGPAQPPEVEAVHGGGIACCQLELAVGDVAGNLRRAEDAVRAAAAAGARLIVLPELLASGYCLPDATTARSLAEDAATGPTASLLGALATELDVVLVAGVCEDGGEVLHNSAVLVDASGVRVVYRKVHLWDAEPDLFVPGDAAPPVVETALGRVAVMIRYDLEFPEWVRLAALAGADVVAVPACWPRGAWWPAGERPPEQVKALAAAATNGLAVAVCDRAGAEPAPARMDAGGGRVSWIGGSLIADATGAPVAIADAGAPGDDGRATVLHGHVDLRRSRDKRVSARNDLLADRRPELYAALASTTTRDGDGPPDS